MTVIVKKLVENVMKPVKSSPISTYLFHLYHQRELLNTEEMVQYWTGMEITKYECSFDDQQEVEEEEDLPEQTEVTKGVKEEGHLGEDTASGSHRKNTKPDFQRPWKNPVGKFRPPPENEMNLLDWASYHMWMANKEWEGHLTFIGDVCSALGRCIQ